MTPYTETCAVPSFVDIPRLAECIAQVESGGNPNARGKDGELGLYQFTPAAWAEVSEMPFVRALEPLYADIAARARLRRLRTLLIERRLDASPGILALAWHVGLSGAILRTFQPNEARDYAERVENLYLDR